MNVTIITLALSILGVGLRWWWTNRKRDKEIVRLEKEKQGDIRIHAEIDKENAQDVNPPNARDNADRV